MLNVPRALSVPLPGIGVLSASVAAPRAGHVRLRRSSREPASSKRAAGSTESSMMRAPPFSNSASRSVTCMPGTGPAVGDGSFGVAAAATSGDGPGPAGRSARRRKSARSESSPWRLRATSAHGVFTRSRSMPRRVGHARSMPLTSTRLTVSSGFVPSRNARSPAPRLPLASRENGSSVRATLTSPSAAPRTWPTMGSQGCSAARSMRVAFTASSARRVPASTVPLALTRPPAISVTTRTRAGPREGHVTSSAFRSRRGTVTVGWTPSVHTSSAPPTLPLACRVNGCSTTPSVTSASAVPRTRPAAGGSHGCSAARSTLRALTVRSARCGPGSTVPRAVRWAPATSVDRRTRAGPREGQLTSSAVRSIRAASTRRAVAASLKLARPSTRLSRVTATSTAGDGAAAGARPAGGVPAGDGARAGGGEGGNPPRVPPPTDGAPGGVARRRARAARFSVPSAARSTVAEGSVSVRSATRTVAG